MKGLHTFVIALVAAGAFWARPATSGEELVVIVNPASGVTSLSRAQLAPIFLTRAHALPGGERALPVNLPDGSPVRAEFDEVVLGMSGEDVARYWIDRKIRGGSRPPPKLPSAPLVLRHVEGNKGGIGYVPSGSVSNGVRVIARVRGGQLVAP